MIIKIQPRYLVYIIGNSAGDLLQAGISSDPSGCLSEWRKNAKRKNCRDIPHIPLYQEMFHDLETALQRKQVIDKLSRKKKELLILSRNPSRKILWEEIAGYIS